MFPNFLSPVNSVMNWLIVMRRNQRFQIVKYSSLGRYFHTVSGTSSAQNRKRRGARLHKKCTCNENLPEIEVYCIVRLNGMDSISDLYQ